MPLTHDVLTTRLGAPVRVAGHSAGTRAVPDRRRPHGSRRPAGRIRSAANRAYMRLNPPHGPGRLLPGGDDQFPLRTRMPTTVLACALCRRVCRRRSSAGADRRYAFHQRNQRPTVVRFRARDADAKGQAGPSFFGPHCRPCDLGRAQTETPLAQRGREVSVGLNRIPVSAGGRANEADADELPLLVHAAQVRVLDDAGPVGGGEARYLDGLPAVAVDQPDVSVR
jgi:hypothetical protein